MKVYKNVVVFKGLNGNTHVDFVNPVPVCLNFDVEQKICDATLRYWDGTTLANITIEQELAKGFEFMIDQSYPAVGGIADGDKPFQIKMIGLCSSPNLDDTIITMRHYTDIKSIINAKNMSIWKD